MLAPRWPNTPLSKYPHLPASEHPIWDNFIRIFGHEFEGFDYDTAVGRGIPLPPDRPLSLEPMWQRLTQSRIDAVGFRSSEIWIFEVKQRPRITALGQALGGMTLYESTFSPGRSLIPCIVSDIITPHLEDVLASYDIRFYDTGDHHANLRDSKGFDLDARPLTGQSLGTVRTPR